MTRRFPLLLALPISLAAFNLACSGPTEGPVTAKGAALYRAADCDDLLVQIQTDAKAKLDAQVALYKKQADEGYFGGGGRGGGIGIGVPTNDNGAEAPGADGGLTSGGDAEGESSGPPSSHSETNTQVLGVDEADIVKTDGERIYLVHGDRFFLVDSWPADQTSLLGSTPIEGSGVELFVEGSKATLFSNVYLDEVTSRKGTTGGGGIAIDCYDCYGGPTFTKISTFDVSGDAPVLEREIFVEGGYVSSRRHGDVVRTIVQGGFAAPGLYYPDVSFYDSFGNPLSRDRVYEQLDRWRSDVARDIDGTTLEDWIPRRFERSEGALVALDPECSDYYVPEPGAVEYGVAQVVTFDVTKNDVPHVTAILGGAQTVYANSDKLVLAQPDWSFGAFGMAEGTDRSSIHQFSIDGTETNYEASGFVDGHLVNQFAIDERRGTVRLATTAQVVKDAGTWDVDTENRVFQLVKDGNLLEVASKSAPFGKPDERIMSARFVGDRAYAVTFLQTDPLVVLDVTTKDETTVLGELFIPGFSEYMHPLDATHLLTIGQDGTDEGTNGGIALQIFDVSNPTAPALTFKESYANAWSEASYNHKAFTFVSNYFADGEGLLLFPITTYDPTYRSVLEVVKVRTTGGFEKLGSLDHTSLLTSGCASDYELYGYCSYGGEEMRRGVSVEDYIYAISYGGLTVQSLDDLSTPVATVALPAPTFWSYGYEGGGDFGGVGGSEGIATPEEAPAMGGASGL